MKTDQIPKLDESAKLDPNLELPRRLRSSARLRDLVSETNIDVRKLVMPIFVQEGKAVRAEIKSMPGIYRYSPDKELDREIQEISDLGISAVLLFGLPAKKDAVGSESYNPKGVVQQALHRIKNLNEDLIVISDVCMCEYTDHGHCGLLSTSGKIDNARTISSLGKIAVSHARAGADMVAPSAMMDDQVMAVRTALDSEGFSSIPIMAYSSKFASSFYGPFREAANSAPSFGDRRTYQMDSRNIREAMKEIELDIRQGADIVMVKPALPYLDVISEARKRFTVPIATYNVSGEYSMVKAASLNTWIDEAGVVIEILASMKRAGADIIITYFAKDFASRSKGSKH
jgi:porphobilinogen synthase